MDVKRELSTSKADLDKTRNDNFNLQSQVDKLQETINEYKNTLNKLAPKEHENAQLLSLIKDLEEKLVTSNKFKTEAESENEKLARYRHCNRQLQSIVLIIISFLEFCVRKVVKLLQLLTFKPNMKRQMPNLQIHEVS